MASPLDTTVEIVEIERVKKTSTNMISCSYLSSSYLFWGTEKGNIFALNLAHGMVKKLGSHLGKVLCLVWNPHEDVQLLFSGSSDHCIKIWNVVEGVRVQSLDCHNNSVMCLNYIGDLTISGSIDKSFKFFKTDRERLRNGLKPIFRERNFKLKYPGNKPRKKDWITSIWTSKFPKSHFDVIIGDNYGNLTFLKTISDPMKEGVITNMEITRYKNCKFGILFIDVSNIYVIITYNNNSIVLYDLLCRTKFHSIDWKYQIKKSLYNREKGNIDEIIFISQDSLMFYNLNRNRMVFRKRFSGEAVNSLILSNNRLFLQKMSSFTVFEIRRTIPFIKCTEHTDPVIGLVIERKKRTRELLEDEEEEISLMSVGQDSYVSFFSVNQFEFKLEKKKKLKKHERAEIYCMQFLAPKHIITGHTEGYVCFYNFHFKKVSWYKPHANTCSSLHVFHFKDKSFLLTGDFDGTMVRCNITSMINLGRNPWFEKKLVCSYSAILSINYSKDLETILVGDGDGVLGLYSVELKRRFKFKAHDDGVTQITIDGDFVFTASEDGSVKQWNLMTEDLIEIEKKGPIQVFNFHETDINIMRMSVQDEDCIITTDRTGRLLIWNYKTRKLIFQYQKRNSEITAIEFFNKNIFCGMGNGMVLKLTKSVQSQ